MITIQGVGQNGNHILAQVKFSTKIQNTLNITIECALIFPRFNCHLVKELRQCEKLLQIHCHIHGEMGTQPIMKARF